MSSSWLRGHGGRKRGKCGKSKGENKQLDGHGRGVCYVKLHCGKMLKNKTISQKIEQWRKKYLPTSENIRNFATLFVAKNCIMTDLENTLAGIERKVRRLVEENNRLRSVEAELRAEGSRLQEQINNQNITINHLKEQNTILKLGNALTEKGDSTEVKLKINQLIRNIDKCLESL